VNEASGATQWEHPDPRIAEVEMSGSVIENPMQKSQSKGKNQHHTRNSTQLPGGWAKDKEEGQHLRLPSQDPSHHPFEQEPR
jgi:hypothetical protein